MPEYVAPAGTPITATDLGAWLANIRPGDVSLHELSGLIRRSFSIQHCYLTSSGRAAMVILLRALAGLRSDPARNQVIVPGYTCYSVAASVERADLRLGVSDIDGATLSYDLSRLAARDFGATLAVVTANLYGIPDALPEIERVLRSKGAFLIDDAAQSLGARVDGRSSGTFGDAGIFSFDKGKNITSFQGGVIITNSDEIAAALDREFSLLPKSTLIYTVSNAAKLLAYALLLHPKRYWITQHLPFLGLGRTEYTTHYTISK
jgi:hypothetical protein